MKNIVISIFALLAFSCKKVEKCECEKWYVENKMFTFANGTTEYTSVGYPIDTLDMDCSNNNKEEWIDTNKYYLYKCK
jgi:hypothetical protein